MKKGMPMREAYRKAGLKPEEMDWEHMGMDIRTCAKEMTIRPAKYVCHACLHVCVGMCRLSASLCAAGCRDSVLPVSLWSFSLTAVSACVCCVCLCVSGAYQGPDQ